MDRLGRLGLRTLRGGRGCVTVARSARHPKVPSSRELVHVQASQRQTGFRPASKAHQPDRGYLTIVGRVGVWPDSVQVFGGMLSSRLPTRGWGCGSSSVASPKHRAGAWLKSGLPARSSSARPASPGQGRECEATMARVFIGSIPTSCRRPSRSWTISETVLARDRFSTDKAGYATLRNHVALLPRAGGRSRAATAPAGPGARPWPTGSTWWTVPAKLSARARCSTPG